MKVESFVEEIRSLGIETIAGVPDSALQPLCYYLNAGECGFHHFVPANEGAAVGIAIGNYLSTGKPACVYMQNSGIGNIVNPVTSLAIKRCTIFRFYLLLDGVENRERKMNRSIGLWERSQQVF